MAAGELSNVVMLPHVNGRKLTEITRASIRAWRC
jgi:hypothetical protein